MASEYMNNNCYVHGNLPWHGTQPAPCTCQSTTFSPPDAMPSPDNFVRRQEFEIWKQAEYKFRDAHFKMHTDRLEKLEKKLKVLEDVDFSFQLDGLDEKLYAKIEELHRRRDDENTAIMKMHYSLENRIKKLEDTINQPIKASEFDQSIERRIRAIEDKQNPEKYNKVTMSFQEAYSQMVWGKKIKNVIWSEHIWLSMKDGKVEMQEYNDEENALSMTDLSGYWVVVE